MGAGQESLQTSPPAPWAKATTRTPQTIAHRGYKAKYAENSMKAMCAAVEAGADALETDVHLTADGVVVLSHDPTLKRCFGRNEKIRDCLWEDIEKLRSVSDSEVGMARLVDLLEWLASPGRERIWVLLDIKVDDDAGELLTAIAKTLDSSSSQWTQRIMLGCWNATFIKAARRIMPNYSLAHISFSLHYSRHFASELPNLGFNMLQRRLAFPFSSWFLRDAQRNARPVFVWTVNDEYWMEWCLRRNEHREGSKMLIDGVITDDPAAFLEVCERWEGGKQPESRGVRETVSRLWELCISKALMGLWFVVRRYSHGKMDYLDETN